MPSMAFTLWAMQGMLKIAPGNYSFTTCKETEPKKHAPGRKPLCIMKKRIVVPSSVAVYEAAAKLTNYKQCNSLRHSRRKLPHKSLLPQLTPEGLSKARGLSIIFILNFPIGENRRTSGSCILVNDFKRKNDMPYSYIPKAKGKT